jgi:hypothetical protein
MAAPQGPTYIDVEAWVEVTNEVGADLGDVATLAVGTGVVDGINDLNAEIGDLSLLETTDHTSIVYALNEIKAVAFILGLALTTPIN